MIRSILRTPTSYFRHYRNYFIAIYGFFLAFPLREFTLFISPTEALLRMATQFMLGSAVSVGIIWGYLTTKLYFYPDRFSIRDVLVHPLHRINLAFFVYLVPMILTLAAGLVLPDSIQTSPFLTAFYVPSSTTYRVVAYSGLFLAVASSVIIAFVSYPLMVLFYLRSQLKDREVRQALEVMAICFGAISILLLGSNALSSFGYNILSAAHMASVILLIVIVRAFTRPTFLKTFLGVVPALELIPPSKLPDGLILVYGSHSDKFGPISRYVNEGLDQGAQVVYFHYETETIVRDGLSRNGMDVGHSLLGGILRLFPLTNLYEKEDFLESHVAIESCRKIASEARAMGKGGLRLIMDYGEQTIRHFPVFIEHLTNSEWTTPDHYTKIVMAFSSATFQSHETALAMLKSKVQVIDFSESIDLFSRTVGLSHRKIVGKKMLLEYSPLSDYERVLRSLLAECASNFEKAIVFTRKDSPLYSAIGEQPSVKTFVLTSRVAYSKVESENRVLVPTYDSSLLLDALNKTIEAYAGASFTIVFDSISHYVYSLGMARAYSLVRQALELMISDKITAVFLMNLGSHDERTALTFENLFDIELIYKQGGRVPEVHKGLTVTT